MAISVWARADGEKVVARRTTSPATLHRLRHADDVFPRSCARLIGRGRGPRRSGRRWRGSLAPSYGGRALRVGTEGRSYRTARCSPEGDILADQRVAHTADDVTVSRTVRLPEHDDETT